MNAKDPSIEQFITLRARGVPYAKTPPNSTSRRALSLSESQFADRLSNQAAIENEVAHQAIRAADRARALQVAARPHSEELSQRPLKEIPTDRLFAGLAASAQSDCPRQVDLHRDLH
jgi:hypothetical protein